ncbi:hypothetical protein [Limnohabitans sp.]|jgi:hypothetical protein|uniref:hypothetical protein n=1 Tax=Limnohabitans sp. TaxID=1907725 RepID=UPI0037C04C24
MKRSVAAVLALVTSVLVVDSHVDWVRLDNRPLLALNGMHFDLHGWGAEQWLRLHRDCAAVQVLDPDSPHARALLRVVQQHSLPDSQSARWLQLQQLGDWLVAEVAFDTLKPTLVVLRQIGTQWHVQDQAVWSGSTAPWQAAHFVRLYLRQQAPDLPEPLLACFPVEQARYGQGPGGLGPVNLSPKERP